MIHIPEIECPTCDGHGHPAFPSSAMIGSSDTSYGVGVWIGRIQGLEAHLRIIARDLPGEDTRLHRQVASAQAEARRYVADFAPCPACNGIGWRPMNENELDAAAEQQAEDAMSEPPMSLDEQHRRAWDQKQELRR